MRNAEAKASYFGGLLAMETKDLLKERKRDGKLGPLPITLLQNDCQPKDHPSANNRGKAPQIDTHFHFSLPTGFTGARYIPPWFFPSRIGGVIGNVFLRGAGRSAFLH
jgi:hypothetical protein